VWLKNTEKVLRKLQLDLKSLTFLCFLKHELWVGLEEKYVSFLKEFMTIVLDVPVQQDYLRNLACSDGR